MKKRIWQILSNPPDKDVQGFRIPKWNISPLEERKAMVDAIVKEIEK